MADRPQNYCRDCGYQWFPRGPGPARCPGCRGPNVGAVMSLDDPEPAPPAGSSRLTKILILAAAGVVLHAVAGTLAVYLLRDDPKPREPEVAVKAPAPAPKVAPRVTPRQTEPPVPPKARPKETEPPAPAPPETDPPAPAPPEPVTKTPEPETKTPDPAPKPPDPAPKSAPEPARSPFPPPAGSWVSAWEKAGDVRVRVVGVAESKVPLEARKKKVLSADAYFVVWVEVENTSAANHTYRRWQPVTTGECTVRYAAGNALAFAYYPPDASREWFTEFTQPLPAGGPPLLESLVFSRPDPATDGPLTLTLDATRAGGTGRVTITIPHAVWARRAGG